MRVRASDAGMRRSNERRAALRQQEGQRMRDAALLARTWPRNGVDQRLMSAMMSAGA
jgi:hypothetical protein